MDNLKNWQRALQSVTHVSGEPGRQDQSFLDAFQAFSEDGTNISKTQDEESTDD